MWLVGGCVRDALLGVSGTPDYDLVTECDSIELVEWLYAHGFSDIPPVTYPRFGTAMTRLDGIALEWVTARSESYEEASRKPDVAPASLRDDAFRRDFTVNALMCNLHTGEMMDWTGHGLNDLKHGNLRTPLDPSETFSDDPLRMVRAVRFRAQLGFEFVPELEEAMGATIERLRVVSQERFRDELLKMIKLKGARTASALRDLQRLGILALLIQELEAMVGVEQGQYHFLDVWEHTLLVVQNADTDDPVLALACLLHDVGKPLTRSIDEKGQTRFFTHETVGADMARAILRRLKFQNEIADDVALLVRNHMRLGTVEKLSIPAGRRLIRDLGDQLDHLLELVEADASALKVGVRVMDLSKVREKLSTIVAATPAETLRSPLSGEQVMDALGIGPGPAVGRAQKYLSELVVDGHLEPGDVEGALERLSDDTTRATLLSSDQ